MVWFCQALPRGPHLLGNKGCWLRAAADFYCDNLQGDGAARQETNLARNTYLGSIASRLWRQREIRLPSLEADKDQALAP